MTHIKNNFTSTLFLAISLLFIMTSCASIVDSTEPVIKILPHENTSDNNAASGNAKELTSEAENTTLKTQQLNNDASTQDESVAESPLASPQVSKPAIEIKTINSKPVTNSNSNYPTLTDDQIAMTAEELLNDPDLLRPLRENESTEYSETENLESYDDDEEFSAPEEINFDDDFDVPEYAQTLLDESYPDYSPPSGKLFGFMRRHLLKRGDSPKPWTVEDDFNGDNKPDWAALMVSNEKQLDVIVIYSEDDKYRLEVLYEGAGIDNNSIKIALSQEKPGDKVGASFKNKPGKFRTATLEFPGINIMYYTKSSSLFYWSKYYFDELLTSN